MSYPKYLKKIFIENKAFPFNEISELLKKWDIANLPCLKIQENKELNKLQNYMTTKKNHF